MTATTRRRVLGTIIVTAAAAASLPHMAHAEGGDGDAQLLDLCVRYRQAGKADCDAAERIDELKDVARSRYPQAPPIIRVRDMKTGHERIGKRSAGCCILILVEVEKRIVAVVTDVWIVAGPAPEVSGIETFTDVLINFPGDAGLFEKLGIR